MTSHVSPAERAHRLERQRRLALVRDGDHHVGVGRAEDRLECLHRDAARLRRVERRAAARVDDAGTLGQRPVGRDLPEPVRLREDRALRLVRHTPLYTIARVPEYPWTEHAHEIWSGDRLVAEAMSVLVGYDYARNESVPLTDDVKRRLAA